MDYDIVVKCDISELYSPCDTGIKIVPAGIPVRGQLLEATDDYDMTAEGVSAGLMVFHDSLKNYMQLYRFCYEKLERYSKILYLPEQAIFDFMIQEFGLKPTPIDGRVYSPHPSVVDNAARAKIIHAYGQPKFWNGIKDNQWDRNYNTWLRMGGSESKPLTITGRLKKRAVGFCRRLIPV